MFPSRKWVAEGGQVVCEPLLPKLHPPLEPVGGPRPWEQKNLPSLESWPRGDRASAGNPAATEVQTFTSKHTTWEGTQREVRAHGDRGTPFHLAYPRCQACTGERVMEVQVCVCVCVCVCARRGSGEAKISHHHQLSSLPPFCSLITLSCVGRVGVSPIFPQQEAKEAQPVHLPRHILVELVNNGGGGPWHKEVIFSWGSRGGRSLCSPAVTGGWGEPALLLP